MPSSRWTLAMSWLTAGSFVGCSLPGPAAAEEVVAACDAAGRVADETGDFARGGESPTPVADTVLGALDDHDGVREAIEELNRRLRGLDEGIPRGPERNHEVDPVDRALGDAEHACNEAGYDDWILPRE